RLREARGPESTYRINGSKGPQAPGTPLNGPLLGRGALCFAATAALVAVLLHLAGEVVRQQVQRVPGIVRALGCPQGHALQLKRALGHLLAELLPELDVELRKRRDLPRHLPQLLLYTREKLFVRVCAASTLQL